MSDLLPFVIAGLTVGAIYGLAAVGLVLTYKTSGIFNFAHGAIATVSAYAFYELHVLHGASWPIAATICILVVGPLLGLVLEFLARGVATATLELRVAATIGILLIIQSAILLHYGQTETRAVPVFLPQGDFQLGGTAVQYSDLITFLFAVTVTIGLSLFFKRARRGLAMRAAVGDAELLGLAATNPATIRRLAWMIGTSLAAASGVLFAPVLQLDPVLLTLLVVQAFGAAAIGRFSSLPMTFAGGLIIGVLASLCTKWFTTGILASIPSGLPFIVLFVVLLVLPKRQLLERHRLVVRRRASWQMPDRLQLTLAVPVFAVLLLVPQFAGIHLTDWTVTIATVVIFLSLGLLVRTSGQVSLGHVAFIAIGAAVFSRLTGDVGLPWFPALLATGLIAVPVGALLAIPAIRLSGLYLALATFGFAVLLQYVFYTQGFMFGDAASGLREPRPSLFASDTRFYYLVLGLATAASVLVVALNRSRLGRLLRGLSDSSTALSTSGTTVEVTRVLVFCLSAFLASIGGALAAVAATTSSADAYPPLLSLTYFALVVIVVGREPWYALMAAVAMVLLPAYDGGANTTTWSQLAFGVIAVGVAISNGRLAVPAPVRAWADRTFAGRAHAAATPLSAASDAPVKVVPTTIEVAGLEVRFGGLVAVSGVNLRAATGTITGLIGPNGAGKTTTFNVCSGLQRPTSGTVTLDGHAVSGTGPARRARLGLGRTFQQMQLFESLTVRENVAAGIEGSLAGGNPLLHVLAARGQHRQIRAATDSAMLLCDIADLADRRVSDLATGQRRLVELARCLAGPFRVLLLDEPSSGLDKKETARFAEILQRAVAERGIGILLVEHDMSLVLSICDDIYVLDFGKPIFHGSPEQVRASPIVQAAYLGDPKVEEATHVQELTR